MIERQKTIRVGGREGCKVVWGNNSQQNEGVEKGVKISILFYYYSCNSTTFFASVE